ncbi:MAG: glycosyltransferase family 2 protein, partial [Kiritimatiellae bacterium]|nr:glycosyltransferase family 2 protein [Kiritimatiellia bacterium]
DDDKVGGVCGRLIFLPLVSDGDVDDGDSPESSYWGWETRLKMAESVLDSCLGANGAIYAMRSELFWDKIADNTLIDDFVLGMKIREQGLRMVYEPDAVAEEVLPVQTAEWGRRVRIGAGAYQSLGFCGRCLLPSYGKFSWMFWSHKVLRWFTPHLLLFLLGCLSYWLVAGSGENQILHVGITSCVIVVMSIAMFFAKKTGLRDSRLAQPFLLLDHFVTMQVALFFGFVRYCRGGLKGQWTRTPRSSE